MCKLFDILWPRLERESESDKNDLIESKLKEINQIEQSNWEPIESVLGEARALFVREEERRKSADKKATIYLAVLAAIVPFTAALIKDSSNAIKTFEVWQIVVLIVIFLYGLFYLLAAGIWAFRTIKVSGHHRVDVADLINLSNCNEIDVSLCRKILKLVRRNRESVNKKTTRLIMTHEFLLRVFVLYVVLLILVVLMTAYPLLLSLMV